MSKTVPGKRATNPKSGTNRKRVFDFLLVLTVVLSCTVFLDTATY